MVRGREKTTSKHTVFIQLFKCSSSCKFCQDGFPWSACYLSEFMTTFHCTSEWNWFGEKPRNGFVKRAKFCANKSDDERAKVYREKNVCRKNMRSINNLFSRKAKERRKNTNKVDETEQESKKEIRVCYSGLRPRQSRARMSKNFHAES